jgi:putative membrane protein
MRVFSLIVVLFIILGIPALLITISNPLAALDTVGGSIASIDGSITFLLQVFIPLIAWVGWASLVIPIITETIARARRVDAVQLPGILRVQQNVAAVLIGLIFASGAGFSNAVAVEAASSAAPAPVATSVSAPATVQAQQEMRQASQSGPSYMVNGSQTLWGIAEATLGDGNRWNEIFVLNQNVVQNDGQALTSPDQWLNDGWVLTLPQDAKIPQLIHPEQSVTIQPGDTLSEIALEHYGDLEAYHFIAGESARQVQPDGTMIQDADLIQPGWQFTLPGATAAPSSAPASESSVPPAASTVPGTQEIGAAEAHSATIPGASAPSENAQKSSAAAATPTASAPAVSAPTADAPSASAHPSSAAVSDASTSADESGIGTSAAHGRPKTDTAPATPNTPAAVAPPAASTPATSAPSQAPTASAPSASAPSAKPANEQGSASSVPGGAIASESAGADSAETHHIEMAGSTQNAQAEETVEDQSFNPVLTGGALLASGLLAAFAARRWSQRRRRRPGQRRPLSSAAAQTLTQLEAEAAPLGLKELDCGLRIISAHCAAINQPIPVLKFLTLDDSKANLYFASDVQLPYPFEGTEDANCWTLPLSSVSETPTPEVAAPWPALITLGDDRSGSAMMLNLEHAGTLQISDPLQSTSAGSPVSEMMGSFAAELLLSPWAEGLRMTFIGVEDSFLTQIAASQITACAADQAQQVLEKLNAQAEELTGWLEREGHGSIAQARAAGADAFPPHIVIVSDAVDELIRWDLMNVVRSLPHVAIAVISHASTLEAESAYNLLLMREAHADPSDLVVKLDPLGVCLAPRLLTSDEAEMVLNLLQEASADPVSPAPDDELLEPLGVSEDDEIQVEDSTFEEQEEQLASAEEAVPEFEQEEEEPEDEKEPAVPSYESGLSPEEMRAETRQIFTHLFGDTDIYRALVEQGNALTHLTDAEVAHPFLALLGPVRLLGAAGPVPRTKTNEPSWGLMDRYAAAAAFLHLHPSVTAESYHSAFWPHEHHSAQSAVSKRNQLTGRVRQWLGTSSDGQQYLPHATAGNYVLSELVTSDWAFFQALTGPDLKDQSTACLLAAFSLVRGVPLEGKASHYAWAENDREEMRDRIIDVAHELLARAQEAQDHRLILQVARQARAIDGSQEAFWTAEIHEEILANNAQKAQDLKNQFMDYLDSWDEEPTDDAAKVLNLAA